MSDDERQAGAREQTFSGMLAAVRRGDYSTAARWLTWLMRVDDPSSESRDDIVRRWREHAGLQPDEPGAAERLVVGSGALDYRALFGALLEHAFDGILLTATADGWILECSNSFLELTGYAREELLGRTTLELELIDPQVRRAAVEAVGRRGAAGGFETRLRRKDGEHRWAELSTQALPGGELLLSVFRDCTQRKTAEEQLREAFGTYLDRDVGSIILSGQFPRLGVELTASVMFVDVRDFTRFAERHEARKVISTLNDLFEVIVPILDDHGGHVDKFLGDGVLAIFGAPERFRDHADRAVAAGRRLVHAVDRAQTPLRVGVGINTGRVVAGSIGGAGRLNFSVIGHAVNVAARVQAATRATGDDLLITRMTRDALVDPISLRSRGDVLVGRLAPVEVFACVEADAVPAAAATAGGNGA